MVLNDRKQRGWVEAGILPLNYSRSLSLFKYYRFSEFTPTEDLLSMGIQTLPPDANAIHSKRRSTKQCSHDLRRSLRHELKQSYIAFGGLYEAVHFATEHLFRNAERVAFQGMKRYMRRHGECIRVDHDIHNNGTTLVRKRFS